MYFGVLIIIRILLFRVVYWGPLFSEAPSCVVRVVGVDAAAFVAATVAVDGVVVLLCVCLLVNNTFVADGGGSGPGRGRGHGFGGGGRWWWRWCCCCCCCCVISAVAAAAATISAQTCVVLNTKDTNN